MTRSARSWSLLALVSAVVVLVAGCSGIPDSGSVQSTNVIATSTSDPFIRALTRPPAPGASQSEIVAGFLAASANFDDDHAAARLYLTDAASQTWRPDVGVAVYDADPGYQLADFGPGKVRMLALHSAGTIDARGQFNQPVGSTQYRANFTVRKVGTQWRISGLPQGLILSTGDITRAYRSVNMFFLDIAGGVLVPDPIFLPARQPGIATSLTRQLLAGPTAWLKPAVRTAVPTGTHLGVDSVPVEDGVARVDLDRSALAATGDERRQFAAQLTYTLTQLPDITGVRITLNGVPYAVPGIGGVSTTAQWASFDPDATPLDGSTYAIVGGHLAVVTTGTQPVTGYFGTLKNLRTAAVALDGRLVAGILQTGSGSDVRIGPAGGATAPVVYTGRRVTSVSFDRLNSAWIADRSNGRTTMWALRSGLPALKVRLEGFGTRSIEVARVSRDGARIALVLAPTAGAAGQLYLGRIERGTGTPVVSGLRRIESTLSDVGDVAWADDTTLLTIARRPDEPVQTFTVGVDGDSVESAGAVPSLEAVAACPGRPNLAGTVVGTLWVDRGTGWRAFASGTIPIYPG